MSQIVPAPGAAPIEQTVPICLPDELRIVMAARCRDADWLPKVPQAGAVVASEDGGLVQIMHNGLRVVAGGYYGDWTQRLIAACRGHHEPQEESGFAALLPHLPADATMIELGGYWSYYTLWFLWQHPTRRGFVVEPDPAHLAIGRRNAALNGCAPVFIQAFVGGAEAAAASFRTEESGVITQPCVSVPGLMAAQGIGHLDLLHCDAQGVELAVIRSCLALGRAGRLDWFVISTHSHHISGDPLTHQRCLAALTGAGAAILLEHDVQESFSGDGLIIGKFGAVPAGWQRPPFSFNRASESLFRHPLYDLAARPAAAGVPAAPCPHPALRAAGGLYTPARNASLGDEAPLLLPFDEVIFPHVARTGGWSEEAFGMMDEKISWAGDYVLLDIGANIGLFARQAARRYPAITSILCVEPEPGNFAALRYNLAGLAVGRARLWNTALAAQDGTAALLRDRGNLGNYSLNEAALRDRPFDKISVTCTATQAWMRAHVPPPDGRGLLWKSDTQGHDELIVSLTPEDIWQRVEFAIIELWRIAKPDFDLDAFLTRIAPFAGKSLGASGRANTADVAAFLQAADGRHADLYLWRD